jgi:hypothetical protein
MADKGTIRMSDFTKTLYRLQTDYDFYLKFERDPKAAIADLALTDAEKSILLDSDLAFAPASWENGLQSEPADHVIGSQQITIPPPTTTSQTTTTNMNNGVTLTFNWPRDETGLISSHPRADEFNLLVDNLRRSTGTARREAVRALAEALCHV